MKEKCTYMITNKDYFTQLLKEIKKTRASDPLDNQRAIVQRKNIIACELMLPKSLSFTEKI